MREREVEQGGEREEEEREMVAVMEEEREMIDVITEMLHFLLHTCPCLWVILLFLLLMLGLRMVFLQLALTLTAEEMIEGMIDVMRVETAAEVVNVLLVVAPLPAIVPPPLMMIVQVVALQSLIPTPPM